MPHGKERPSIAKAKSSGNTAPLAQAIRDGLSPYLPAMLKTIGQAGAGPRKRGMGNVRAATDGVKLMIEAIGKTSGDNAIESLLREAIGKKPDERLWDEEEFADTEEDTELEDIQAEIDGPFIVD